MIWWLWLILCMFLTTQCTVLGIERPGWCHISYPHLVHFIFISRFWRPCMIYFASLMQKLCICRQSCSFQAVRNDTGCTGEILESAYGLRGDDGDLMQNHDVFYPSVLFVLFSFPVCLLSSILSTSRQFLHCWRKPGKGTSKLGKLQGFWTAE